MVQRLRRFGVIGKSNRKTATNDRVNDYQR